MVGNCTKMAARAKSMKVLNPALTGGKAETLLRDLKNNVIGQDDAIDTLVTYYQQYVTGVRALRKPVCTLLFLGPTGTGKTHIVEELARSIHGNRTALVKIDCAEFQRDHDIAKLVGAPPGYLGHRETKPLLSQEALNNATSTDCKLSLVLFDEIEKASPDLFNLLLGVTDKGLMTSADNRKIDFSNSMIVMTSNLGARQMQESLTPKFGFTKAAPEVKQDELNNIGIREAKKRFSVEFFNRISRSVVFRPLTMEEINKVLDLELVRAQGVLLQNHCSVGVTVTEPARQKILAEGYSLQYGCRNLQRTIEKTLLKPMSSLLGSKQIDHNDFVLVDLQDNDFVYLKAFSLKHGDMASFAEQVYKSPAAGREQLVKRAAKAAI